MANIKSAAKRARQSIRRTARNRMRMKTVRTFEKKLRLSIDAKDKDQSQSLLKTYMAEISKAAKKGIIHRNLASRKIGRIASQVSKLG